MVFCEFEILYKLFDYFVELIVNYLCYQIDFGVQVVQMFDFWVGQFSLVDYDIFVVFYQKKVVDLVKQMYFDIFFIFYIFGSVGVIEWMVNIGVDIVLLDWIVDMVEVLVCLLEYVGVQGNVDFGLLFGILEVIEVCIDDCVCKVCGWKYIFNFGYGILLGILEENGEVFFWVGKSVMDCFGVVV